MMKLNFREKFSAFVILSIGIIYLLLYIISFFQNESSLISESDNAISINKTAFLENLRIWINILFPLIGGMLMFKIKQAGWVISMGILPVFLMIVGGLIATVNALELFDLTAYVLYSGALILALAFLFMLFPSTLRKFKIGLSAGIISLILAAINALIFFFLA